MKICTAQLLLALTLCGISMAHSNYAQVLDKQVTIALQDVPFYDALKAIGRKADVNFAYSKSLLQQEEKVTLQADQQSLRAVLDELLSPRNIKYIVHEKEGLITLKKEQHTGQKKDRAFVPAQISDRVLQQITGAVTDALTGQPMPGVNVLVKGTTVGTTTDANGKFSLDVDTGDVLVFSFIGYLTTELRVGDESEIEIALQEDITSLKEVVVNAGYYEITKEFQTGSIVKVRADEISRQPVSNPLAALQTIVPGLQVTQSTGVPGGNFQVRIRGINSISSGNDPLYIIDGLPFISGTLAFNETSGSILGNPAQNGGGGTSPLNWLNPSDIESIEVLKDADATTIYGSRGANGVILITTKKGIEGKPRINLNYYQGLGTVPRKAELLNSQQYLEMRHEAIANDNVTPHIGSQFVPGYAPDLLVWDTTRNTDWQEKLIGGTARITDAQLSLSGGERNTTFVIGGGFHRETTVFPGENADKRISAHIGLQNTSPDKRLEVNFSMNYSVNITDFLRQDLTQLALTLAPVAPALHKSDGQLNWENGTWINPLSFLNTSYRSRTNSMMSNLKVSYALLPNLTLKTNFGYSDTGSESITQIPKSAANPVAAPYIQNIAYFSKANFNNWIIEPQLNWRLDDVAGGKLDFLIGTTFLDQTTKGGVQFGSGFTSEALMKNIGAASTIQQLQNHHNQYRYNAVFGRINYLLKDRYIVNATVRRDGSSRFGPDKQFANFGAIGLAWIFSKENLITRALPLVSFGKLRASYGTSGNDQIGDYAFLDTYSTGGSYQGVSVLNPMRLNNPDFSWELNKKIDVAVEFGFLDDRISLEANYYYNRSSSQLVGFTLPPTTGFPSVQGNLAATIQNSGTEILARAFALDGTDLKWKIGATFTRPRNELIDFPNLDMTPAYANQYAIGEPLSIRKAYYFSGVDPETGLYTFEDTNGDGILNLADRKHILFVGQKYYGGFQNNFSFKQFALDITVQFVNQTGLAYNSRVGTTPGFLGNQNTEVMNRWRQEGDDKSIQRFSASFGAVTTQEQLKLSERAVTDASFIRIKNISFSYSLPRRIAAQFRIQDAKAFVQAQNLFTFTSYKGLDPENTFTQGQLPPLRVITCGLSFNF